MRWTDWAEFSLFKISPPLHRHHEFIPLCIYSHILLLQTFIAALSPIATEIQARTRFHS